MNSAKEKQGLEFLDRLISKQIKGPSINNAYAPTLPCPDENTFGAFLENALSGKEKIEFEAHLAACVTCQAQMAGLLKVLAAEPREASSWQKPTPASAGKRFGFIPHGLFGELGLAHAFSAILIMSALIYSSVSLLKYGNISELSKPIVSEFKTLEEREFNLRATELGAASKEKDSLAWHYEQAQPTPAPSSKDLTERPAKILNRQDAASGGAKAETAREPAKDKADRPYADASSSGAGTIMSSLSESALVDQPAPAAPPASTEHKLNAFEPKAKPPIPTERPLSDRTEATLSQSDKATNTVAPKNRNLAPIGVARKSTARSEKETSEMAIRSGLAGTAPHVGTTFKEIEENLRSQIAQRLDALGISRGRGRSMVEAERARMNAPQTALFSERAETKVQSAKKEFFFVDGIWVDKEILQTSNQPVKWIKFGSEEYKKLLTDQEDLKKHITLGERVLVIHQNQIYYIYTTK